MTGLADALMMAGLRYGSVEAAERAGPGRSAAQPISRLPIWRGRRVRSRCSTGMPTSPARLSAGWTRTCEA